MKSKKYQASDEKTILTALIVHDNVLSTVCTKLGVDKAPFKNKWSNQICRWCFDYFQKYGKAPRKSIQSLFEEWAEDSSDEDSVDLVERFLSSLSQEHEQLASEMNEAYLIDLASKYFERVRLAKMAEDIQEALDRGELDVAKEAQANFEPIRFASTDWADPFQKEEIKDTFRRKEEQSDIVIQLKGDLGKFMSPYLRRGSFVSFVGPEKRGKSFWLMEMAWQALRQNRRVLYYVLGDMSKEETKTRLYSRIARLPEEEEVIQLPLELRTPRKKDESVQIKWGEEERYPALHGKAVWEATQKLRECGADGMSRLRFRCAGADEITASMIEQDVEDFNKQGWAPDAVVLDYGDLVAKEPHTKRLDLRHQIDATWKIFRRIALKKHLLFLTATQASADAYNAKLIRKDHFSEDKRKNAHVTGMAGINQTPEEKDLGVYRINWLFLRGGKWGETKVCYTVGNLAIANPCILSSF